MNNDACTAISSPSSYNFKKFERGNDRGGTFDNV